MHSSLEESARPVCAEDFLLSPGGGARHAVEESELDRGRLGTDERHKAGSHILILHNAGLDNLDRRFAASVARGELGVHLFDGASEGGVPVLFVHIVSAGSRVVTKPHAVVLDVVGLLLEDLVNSDNLSVSPLDLLEFGKEVPEPGASDDSVW
eukprot:CAMPEP_0197515514 /NCGR_PEP_ID=MMETSP1318-20131121/631_1 /TAXON_ID=552666 /ORGANISM="Partenskyella glossopodia, Strain RCC365" /LENGTH=152 /DNA_ID=CAMNT_0043063911 /DNA_START=221 /DNA_END=676 /DNA_ORIENTATION=+